MDSAETHACSLLMGLTVAMCQGSTLSDIALTCTSMAREPA